MRDRVYRGVVWFALLVIAAVLWLLSASAISVWCGYLGDGGPSGDREGICEGGALLILTLVSPGIVVAGGILAAKSRRERPAALGIGVAVLYTAMIWLIFGS